MKLTGNIILRALKSGRQVQESSRTQLLRDLEGPLLYNSQEQPAAGWIYILDTTLPYNLSHIGRRGTLFILTGPEQPQLSSETEGAWICMEPSVSTSAVLNIVTRTFAKYDRWKNRLEEIQTHLGSVDEMLDASVGIFGNPIMVLDSELTVTNWVSDGFFAREQMDFFSSGRERMDVINAILQDPAFLENRTKKECYWGPEYLVGFRSICRNILRNDEAQYSISVIEDNSVLDDADRDLLEILGFYVQFVIYHQDRRVQSRFENLWRVLQSILTDRTFDYLEASRQLDELGWHKDHSYLCLIYQLTYLDRSVLPAVSICRYMEDQYECCSFMHEDEIITFFDLTLTGLDEDDVQRQLKPFIRDSFLKAGFSRVVQGHMNLRHQYLQASISLDVGSRKNPYQWIHYFDQLAFDYMQEQIISRLPADLVIHQGILRLMENDRAQGTEYIKTLRAYLDTGQNAVHAARMLYIHRSTFLYRMEKIRDLLDADLSDPDIFLYISLSMKMMKL